MNIELFGEDHLDALMPLVREYHAFEGIRMPVRTPGYRPAAPGRPVFRGDERRGWRTPGVGHGALAQGHGIEFRGRDPVVGEPFTRESRIPRPGEAASVRRAYLCFGFVARPPFLRGK